MQLRLWEAGTSARGFTLDTVTLQQHRPQDARRWVCPASLPSVSWWWVTGCCRAEGQISVFAAPQPQPVCLHVFSVDRAVSL